MMLKVLVLIGFVYLIVTLMYAIILIHLVLIHVMRY